MNIIGIMFIFITLFSVGFRWLSEGSGKPTGNTILAYIWAALGTFFFHNLLM